MVKEKKQEREISKQRFVVAGIITLLVFLVGILFGMFVDNERFAYQNKQSEIQRLDYESLQLQYLYINYIAEQNETCTALSKALEKTTSELGDLLDKVLSVKDQNPIRNPDYENIYRSYLQSNFKYWILAERAKEKCNFQSVIILYFFSEKNCEICPEQGVVLTYFKKKFGENVLIFPVNVDLGQEETFIGLITSSYNVNTLPSLYIEGELYQGVVSKQDLSEILCKKNKNMCE